MIDFEPGKDKSSVIQTNRAGQTIEREKGGGIRLFLL